MKITSESTTAFDQALARRLPPDLLRMVLHNEDELQRLQAQQPAPDPHKLQAMQARARHAGSTHSNDIHRAIDAKVEQYRLQLVNWTGTDTSRAIWLTRRIYPDGKVDKTGRPCGWRTVYNHLKTLSI